MSRCPYLVALLGLLAIMGCTGSSPCRWVFVDGSGREQRGKCALHECDIEEKPWANAIAGQTGILRVYFGDGQIYQERVYNEGILHGHFRVWYRNGQLEQDVEYQDGKRHGRMRLWYDNGNKHALAHYVEGREHGLYQEWYPDESERSLVEYKNGLRHGASKMWDENGRVVEDGVWKNMQPWEGSLIIYRKRGRPPVVGVYKDGKLVGRAQGQP